MFTTSGVLRASELFFVFAFNALGENMDGAKEYTLHLMAHRQQQ